jgi:hypothetical protein
MAERLTVSGVSCDSERQQAELWQWWQDNRMDGRQKRVHRDTLRDGDGYVIVEWDEENGRPRFVQEQAHDGTFGVEMVYGEDHKPKMAWKFWRVNRPGDAGYVRRKNHFFPDRVVKWISDDRIASGEWRPYQDEGDPWPIPWVDGSGEPLGIPVIHFRNKGGDYGTSELKKAVPIQNLMNKALADLVMSADVDAFPILLLMGFSKQDVDDMRIGPGAAIRSTQPSAKASRLQPADIKKMMDLVDFFIVKMAQTTRTPLSYFQSSRQISSAESQKQDESPLIAKVEDRQIPFGNAWEDVLRMGRKLHNVVGPGGMDEDQEIVVEWQDAQTRNEKELAETARIHKELGVPEPELWAMLGYTPEQIESMTESDEYQARVAMSQLGLMVANAPSEEGEEVDGP